MPTIIILILILGSGIGVITFFVVRTILNPRKISTLESMLKQGRAPAAAKLAKQILAKEPRNCDAHYLLGKAYLADNKPELALMEFKAVNQIGDFSAHCPEKDFRETIARLFATFNQPEESLKEYLLLIKMNPQEGDYYYHVGDLFEARNNSQKATQYYRKAVELDPKHSDAHFKLGQILYRQKKPVEAKQELEIALRFQPDNHKAYYIVGKILKDSHDYVAALHAFEKAQRDPEYKMKALVERGGCYIASGNTDRAVTELERAIAFSKNDASNETLYARYYLAHSFEKMRQLEKAVEQWEKIYAKKPSFRDVAEKLSHYQEVRTDDVMKDYLTCTKDEFRVLAVEVVKKMNQSVRDQSDMPNGCQIISVDADSRWAGTRKIPKLIWFLRVPEMISESTTRALHEEMKKLSVGRGVIFSASNFSRTAITFAETRPIDLIGKEKLQQILKGIDISSAPAPNKGSD